MLGRFRARGATLVSDALGNLYGTTQSGGMGQSSTVTAGTIFELSPGAGGWSEAVLYNFCVGGSNQICPAGNWPSSGLTFDVAGNLYGTTSMGGMATMQGDGVVYKLTPISGGWSESVLHASSSSFRSPNGNVEFDSLGNLFGALAQGGMSGNKGGVFKLDLQSGSSHIYSLDGTNGSIATGVIVDQHTSVVYGVAEAGGTHLSGTIFRIGTQGKLTSLYNFCQRKNCIDGQYPIASLIQDPSGNAYGTTQRGGTTTQGASYGVVYEISP